MENPPPYQAQPPMNPNFASAPSAPQPQQFYPPPQGQPYPPPAGGQYPAAAPPQPNKQYPQPGPPAASPVGYQQAPTQTVIVQPQIINRFPTLCTCPNCRHSVQTTVTYETGMITWVLCLTICFFLGGFLGWCLIPCCIDSCKDAVHTCPNCGVVIGVYKPM